MTSEEVKYTIKLVDQFGKPLDVLSHKVDIFNGKKVDPFRNMPKTLARLRTDLERYKRGMDAATRSDHVRRYNALIGATEQRIRKITDAAQECKTKTNGLLERIGLGPTTIGLLKAGGIMGIARGVVNGVVNGVSASTEASSQIEIYEASLKNMLGTSDAARERMQEYFAIAKQKPFDLPQVVEAGNKLQALGRYSRDNVTMLGDLAAASGKPMEQAMSAFAKMASGQKGIAVDMFRDLMITTDDWTKATGKGVSKNGELLASTEELIAALPKIMKSKGYFGMMATQANTTKGRIANLKDSLFQLKVTLGDKLTPTVSSFSLFMGKAVDKINKFIGVPIEQKIAREKAELNSLVESLISSTNKEDERKRVIDELQRRYPDFLKSINIEKATTEELRKELEKTNAEYDKKMRKAAYKRRIDAIEADAADSMDDITKYQTSIAANKRLSELRAEERALLREAGFADGNSMNYRIGSDGSIESQFTGVGGSGSWNSAYKNWATAEQAEKASRISAEKGANSDLITWFGNDQRKLAKARAAYEQYTTKISILKDLMGVDTPDPTKTVTPDPTKTPLEPQDGAELSAVNSAVEAITAGGKQVKNFNITINDGLVNGVTNNFASSSDNPDTAKDFMWRLSNALQLVLNDVNYAAQ